MFGDPRVYGQQVYNETSSLAVYRDSQRLFGHEKSVSVLSNNQSQMYAINNALTKASMMLKEGAYMHHYKKFGVEKEQFEEAILVCEETLAQYASLK